MGDESISFLRVKSNDLTIGRCILRLVVLLYPGFSSGATHWLIPLRGFHFEFRRPLLIPELS